jgi:glutathione S-transferase
LFQQLEPGPFSFFLDHIPKDLVDRVAPALVQHNERVASNPKIAAYYAARKKA